MTTSLPRYPTDWQGVTTPEQAWNRGLWLSWRADFVDRCERSVMRREWTIDQGAEAVRDLGAAWRDA